MKAPDSAQVFDSPNSTYWFDSDGILCVITKQAPELPLEEQKAQMQKLKALIGDKKICMLIDVTHSNRSSSAESREYNSKEVPKFTNAMAFIISSPLTRMLAYLFFAFTTVPFPIKTFSNEEEARDWLKQYL